MAKVTFEAMKKCLNLVNSILSQAYTLSDPYLLILFSTLKKVLFEDLHFRNNSFYSIRIRLHRFLNLYVFTVFCVTLVHHCHQTETVSRRSAVTCIAW